MGTLRCVIDAVSEPGRRGVQGHSTPYEHDQCRHGDARGTEVSLRSFGQDQLVQRQIGNGPAQSFIFLLQPLQFLKLIRAYSTVFVWWENAPLGLFLYPSALQR